MQEHQRQARVQNLEAESARRISRESTIGYESTESSHRQTRTEKRQHQECRSLQRWPNQRGQGEASDRSLQAAVHGSDLGGGGRAARYQTGGFVEVARLEEAKDAIR